MSNGASWHHVMRDQQQEIERLAAIDAALNEDQQNLDFDISNVLKRKTSKFHKSRDSQEEDILHEDGKIFALEDYELQDTRQNDISPDNEGQRATSSQLSARSNSAPADEEQLDRLTPRAPEASSR